jgi:hypothetical protein
MSTLLPRPMELLLAGLLRRSYRASLLLLRPELMDWREQNAPLRGGTCDVMR